ncbi:MAG: hypothetical protein LH702_37080 [Phormidesmis sp. CAN_BIN44]|nr:hypothetical protein [Phormidesmis sp. CAN_BIN44]
MKDFLQLQTPNLTLKSLDLGLVIFLLEFDSLTVPIGACECDNSIDRVGDR